MTLPRPRTASLSPDVNDPGFRNIGFDELVATFADNARGLLDGEVTVATRGGDLGISWTGEGAPVMMTGPAETVFEGEIEI